MTEILYIQPDAPGYGFGAGLPSRGLPVTQKVLDALGAWLRLPTRNIATDPMASVNKIRRFRKEQGSFNDTRGDMAAGIDLRNGRLVNRADKDAAEFVLACSSKAQRVKSAYWPERLALHTGDCNTSKSQRPNCNTGEPQEPDRTRARKPTTLTAEIIGPELGFSQRHTWCTAHGDKPLLATRTLEMPSGRPVNKSTPALGAHAVRTVRTEKTEPALLAPNCVPLSGMQKCVLPLCLQVCPQTLTLAGMSAVPWICNSNGYTQRSLVQYGIVISKCAVALLTTAPTSPKSAEVYHYLQCPWLRTTIQPHRDSTLPARREEPNETSGASRPSGLRRRRSRHRRHLSSERPLPPCT